MPLAYALEVGVVAGIAAKEQTQTVGIDHPRDPQRAVAIVECAARKVLGWNSGQSEWPRLKLLPPVQLAHLRPVDAQEISRSPKPSAC